MQMTLDLQLWKVFRMTKKFGKKWFLRVVAPVWSFKIALKIPLYGRVQIIPHKVKWKRFHHVMAYAANPNYTTYSSHFIWLYFLFESWSHDKSKFYHIFNLLETQILPHFRVTIFLFLPENKSRTSQIIVVRKCSIIWVSSKLKM